MELPADNYMLLSYVNTALRDGYSSLEDFACGEGVSAEQISKRLESIGYKYDPTLNAFK